MLVNFEELVKSSDYVFVDGVRADVYLSKHKKSPNFWVISTGHVNPAIRRHRSDNIFYDLNQPLYMEDDRGRNRLVVFGKIVPITVEEVKERIEERKKLAERFRT